MNNVNIKQAVILAGGKGLRLRPITDSVPKPMVLINGSPFLDYLIKSIYDVGIKNILILTGYKSEIIEDYYNRKNINNINIQYSKGEIGYKTGKRLINAYEMLDNHFLLLYGDNYWPIEIKEMIKNYENNNALVSTTVFRNINGTGEYGFENNVQIENNMVYKYDKARKSNKLNGVDIGFFIVDKSIIDQKEKSNLSFEEDFLPPLIKKKKLAAYLTNNQYYYITNREVLYEFEKTAEQYNYKVL